MTEFARLSQELREDRRDPKREEAKPMATGLYLDLYHGRDNPEQDMDDWGYQGPYIGPLQCVKSTYTSELTLTFASVEGHDRFFIRELSWLSNAGETGFQDVAHLSITNDLVEYEGKYYGDWAVFYHEVEA